ncbi:MAG: xanthine dehydrogenase small subunit [Acidobacteria bacterium]|nr:xanthine dehydrogenase small subunit [Acidobacteriota bacterium]
MTATQQSTSGTSSDRVRFILDGEVRTVRDVDPNTTVLNYLRETLRRTGTKEGCAEGDCGACTVVLGELDGDRVRFRAINSCIQFVPTLDGKELFTVESLRAPDGALHPVQEAMVEFHGSQCGFCTPGFIMSLFAMYRSEPEPSKARINDILAGNLCRCTGYRPIIEAAEEMYRLPPHGGNGNGGWTHSPYSASGDDEPSAGEREMVERLRSIERRGTLVVTGPDLSGGRRTYYAPTTIADFAELVERYPDAYILAGGTDIGLWVTKHHMDLDTVIYLGDVAELKVLAASQTHIEIGAAVTITDAHALIDSHFPDMGEMYRRFASPPIRNAATIGGNVANGSPIGDSMPGLIALGASLVLRRGPESRELPMDEFYLAYQKTALEPGEFVERVRVPLEPSDRHFRTYKITKRFDQDISAVCAAYCFRLEDGRARDVRICYGGMAAIPQRASECEQALEGREWNESTLAAGMAALDRDYTPIEDMRASAEYRQMVTRNLLRKLFLETSGWQGETRVIEGGR